MKFIFSQLVSYTHDDNKRKEGLYDENPLCIYLALYCKVIYGVEESIKEKIEIL